MKKSLPKIEIAGKKTDFLILQPLLFQALDGVQQLLDLITRKNGVAEDVDSEAENIFQNIVDVVQDADRLDALGAIGIARTFNYGGFKNRTIYNPDIKPNLNMTKAEYKTSNAPTINHFYEKLLLLKDKMNTTTGHKIAKQRHQYMVDFLKQFDAEWEGEK